MTVQVEIKAETAAKLQAMAAALQLSLDGYLEKVTELASMPQPLNVNGPAPGTNRPNPETPQLTPYELAADLIGSADSSVPDPASPPIHTAFGQHLLEEHLEKMTEQLPLPAAPESNGQATPTKTPYELGQAYIGAVDSSLPDPTARPHDTLLGRMVAEKLKKQGLQLP